MKIEKHICIVEMIFFTDGNAVVLPLPVATVADVKHVPLPKRSVSPMDITEEDYREMLYRHKRRRLDGEVW